MPINYMQMMGNSLELIGHFMFEADAHLELLKLLRSGQLDLNPITTKMFALAEVPAAVEAARDATNLECIVVDHR